MDWRNLTSDSSEHGWPEALETMMASLRTHQSTDRVGSHEPTCSRRPNGPEAFRAVRSLSEDKRRTPQRWPLDPEAPRSATSSLGANKPGIRPRWLSCRDQMERLDVAVGLLERLARTGLPTLIGHTDEATADFPRVGNWNLALAGSLLCPQLRGEYNNEGPRHLHAGLYGLQRQEAAKTRVVW